MPVSPTRVPLNQRFCHSRPETVWFRTPSARAGHRVHADEERGVAALLEELRVTRPLLLDDELAVGVELLGDQRVEREAAAGAVAVHDDDLRRSGRLRAAHGGVDVLRVELATLLEQRLAGVGLLPPSDAGDALHVADHVDSHGVISTETSNEQPGLSNTVLRSTDDDPGLTPDRFAATYSG